VSGNGKAIEEKNPLIRICDEDLASLGSNFVSLGYSKTDANGKFQRFILSSQQNAMCQRFTSMMLLRQFSNMVCWVLAPIQL
jgi:hypothetical protein